MKELPNDAQNNDRAAPKFYKTNHRNIYRYSEPHLSLDKYVASYRPKARVTFDTTDASKPSRDIIEHHTELLSLYIGRPTEDIRVENNSITIAEIEPNEDSNVINNRKPVEDRRGTNDDVPIM